VGKNVFDITRPDTDAPSEPPLSTLLPRVSPAPATAARPLGSLAAAGPSTATVPTPVTAAQPSSAPVVTAPEVGRPPERRSGSTSSARGVGGRPEKSAEPTGGITAVAARVPAALYAAATPLVKGPGRPSWGQLVAWTCQDHAEPVRKEVEALADAAAAPRRLRGPGREGEPTMQVTARLLPDELAAVDAAMTSLPDVPVTRTMVVVAALTVATRPR
jgi:hypothetical protein